MRIISIILTVPIVVIFTVVAWADHCRQVRIDQRNTFVRRSNYVAPIQAGYYAPAFSVGYASGDNQQLQNAKVQLQLEQAQHEITKLRYEQHLLRLRLGVKTGEATLPAKPVAPTHVQLLTKHCSSCHGDGVQKKGGGFMMIDGKGSIDHVDAETRLRMVKRMMGNFYQERKKDTMPPPSGKRPP